jgi:type IV pilus assembly protein PilE
MKKTSGFTLIELMVAVAIVALIVSFALPAYQEYVRQGKIADVTSSLVEYRIRMEQHFQDNRAYDANMANLPQLPVSIDFDFAFSVGPGPEVYEITATGKGAMAGFSYSVDQANARRSVAWGTAGATCWILKDGQTC